MAKMKKAKRKRVSKKSISLTTAVLVSAVSKGTADLAADAKKVMGYTVKEEDGWVVKEDSKGRVVRVSKIAKSKRPKSLILD